MKATNKHINLIFLGGFEYPFGMAGTKRIQNVINGLEYSTNISIRVIVLRQSSKINKLSGVHNGINYVTILGDAFRFKAMLMAPIYFLRSHFVIRNMKRNDYHNILYVYGPPSLDNLLAILTARNLGFKIIFDFVEDFDFAHSISKSLWHRVYNAFLCHMTRRIGFFANGIVVISSHLENKFQKMSNGFIPIHKLLISIDSNLFPERQKRIGDTVNLFYAGSFGQKDGIPVLLDAFDLIASKHKCIRLILTGRGADEAMRVLSDRIQLSPNKNRIEYKGYLDDNLYNIVLNDADILCMPRIDTEYAHAGFPFKLGEFLATGKPVIASAVSDVPKLLTDRRDAMLVTPGDSKAIAIAVDFLINNPEKALEIGLCGKMVACSLFDYREQGKKLAAFLQDIADL